MDGLESRRDNCGAVTRFSPSKKSRIDALMEETEGEATVRQVASALELGSNETAAAYIKLSGYTRLTKRLKPLLSPAHMQSRLKYVVLQDDNAPPHHRAWSTGKTGFSVGTEAAKHNIKREEQPARSPDLNVLDLYVWRVLEAGVHKRRPNSLVELWNALQAAWDEDLTAAKIECAYRLLDPVIA